jgi:hypothetical protein
MWSVKELLILVEAADQYNGDWSTVSNSLQRHTLLGGKDHIYYSPQVLAACLDMWIIAHF